MKISWNVGFRRRILYRRSDRSTERTPESNCARKIHISGIATPQPKSPTGIIPIIWIFLLRKIKSSRAVKPNWDYFNTDITFKLSYVIYPQARAIWSIDCSDD